MNDQLFDRLNDSNDYAYTYLFEIVSSDIANMYYNVDSIRESHDENE